MKHNILRASAAISAATIVLRLLGFLREVVLAATYGAGVVSDAFVIAMSLPGIVLAVFSGAIASVYIPQYTNMEGDRNKFTSNVLTLLFIVGFAFSLVFAVFPQVLVYVFASNIAPETFQLATTFLRVMAWSAIPVLLIGVFRAFLQIKTMFFVAMISDALVSVFVIMSILAGKFTGSLILMGVGAVLGNLASMIVLLLFSARNGISYRPRLQLHDESIKTMFHLMLPLMLSAAVGEINQVVDKNLASSLAIGTVSALNYSAKISSVVTAIIGSSISTALFPKMAEVAAKNDTDSLKKYLLDCVNNLLPILLPLTVGTVLMAEPVIRLLLERGAFVPENTLRTAECLQMYILGLIAANISPLISRTFFAMRQAKWPAILSAIAVAVGIALNLLLIDVLQHRGLALASSVSGTLCLFMLLIALRKRIGTLGLRTQFGEFCKIGLATALMAALVWFAMQNLPILSGSYAQCLLWTVVIAVAGGALYGVALIVLRVKAVWKIIHRILPKKA
jgi:putative peptidoglycan lipid II flippase